MSLDYPSIASNIVDWLKSYLEKSGSDGFVLGISGGIDSAVASVLCRKATKKVLGLILPCHSSPNAENDARQLAKKFSIELIRHDLSRVYESLDTLFSSQQSSPKSSRVVLGNVKARLRMVAIYYHANRLNRLVVGSGNGVEIMLGYFTKHGDGCADIWPLGDLLKKDVWAIGRHLGIPKAIITKPPTADLWPGQTDEQEIGISYEILDQILEDPTTTTFPAFTENVNQRVKQSQHKNPAFSSPTDIIFPVRNLAKHWKDTPQFNRT